MLSYNYLTQWIGWLILLIGAGTVITVLYFALQKISNPGETEIYNKKIITTIKAAVILISIPAFIEVIKRFY